MTARFRDIQEVQVRMFMNLEERLVGYRYPLRMRPGTGQQAAGLIDDRDIEVGCRRKQSARLHSFQLQRSP